MIAVSGHSMGGFSAESAVYLDEIDFATNGFRKINVSLAVGSDFGYVPPYVPSIVIATFGPRSAGMICARYDQFFFDTDRTDDTPGSVIEKDYTEDPQGLLFLDRVDEGTATAGVFYDAAGGQRVIYVPDETHPQNTWSLESGSNTIEFYEEAFAYQLDMYGLDTLEDYGINTVKTGQTWWLKEAFTLVALLALFVLIFPLFAVITGLPLFKKALATPDIVVTEGKQNDKVQLIIKISLMVIAIFLNFYLLTRFMDRADSLDNLVTVLYVIIGIAGVAMLTFWVLFFVKKSKGDAEAIKSIALRLTIIGAVVVIVSLGYRWLLVNRAEIIQSGAYYSAPSINTIVYWAMASGGLILVFNLLANIYFNWKKEDKNPMGVKGSVVQIGTGILSALVLVVVMLFVVALVGWIFNTDFRIYTYAIQIFNTPQFIAGLRYVPLFFVYYFAASISIYMNTRKIKGWLGDVLAAFLLAGPIVIFLVYQYATLYSTGVAAYPTFSLSGILTVGLVPTLSVAGIIMRRFAMKTDNIWASVVFTTLFFTFITLANTTVYLLAA